MEKYELEKGEIILEDSELKKRIDSESEQKNTEEFASKNKSYQDTTSPKYFTGASTMSDFEIRRIGSAYVVSPKSITTSSTSPYSLEYSTSLKALIKKQKSNYN